MGSHTAIVCSCLHSQESASFPLGLGSQMCLTMSGLLNLCKCLFSLLSWLTSTEATLLSFG